MLALITSQSLGARWARSTVALSGALITMLELGWDVSSPCCWVPFAPSSCEWRFDQADHGGVYTIPVRPFLVALRVPILARAWTLASARWCGGGLEGGVHIRLLRSRVLQLRRASRFAEASMLDNCAVSISCENLK